MKEADLAALLDRAEVFLRRKRVEWRHRLSEPAGDVFQQALIALAKDDPAVCQAKAVIATLESRPAPVPPSSWTPWRLKGHQQLIEERAAEIRAAKLRLGEAEGKLLLGSCYAEAVEGQRRQQVLVVDGLKRQEQAAANTLLAIGALRKLIAQEFRTLHAIEINEDILKTADIDGVVTAIREAIAQGILNRQAPKPSALSAILSQKDPPSSRGSGASFSSVSAAPLVHAPGVHPPGGQAPSLPLVVTTDAPPAVASNPVTPAPTSQSPYIGQGSGPVFGIYRPPYDWTRFFPVAPLLPLAEMFADRTRKSPGQFGYLASPLVTPLLIVPYLAQASASAMALDNLLTRQCRGDLLTAMGADNNGACLWCGEPKGTDAAAAWDVLPGRDINDYGVLRLRRVVRLCAGCRDLFALADDSRRQDWRRETVAHLARLNEWTIAEARNWRRTMCVTREGWKRRGWALDLRAATDAGLPFVTLANDWQPLRDGDILRRKEKVRLFGAPCLTSQGPLEMIGSAEEYYEDVEMTEVGGR